MLYKSDCEAYVEEVNSLINFLDINGSDAIELINIYFECYGESWTWNDFLESEVRIVKKTDENEKLITEIEKIEDACIFEGDDYYMITNYDSIIREYMDDCLPKSF